MKKRDDLDTFYSYIMSSLITAEEKENFPRYFYNSFLAGENIVYHKSIAEIKKFNDDWITTLETYFPSIDKIIGNPFSTLRQEEEIVPIEKARKVNSASIKHLAANTHLIKEVVDGEVIPKKILTSHSEIEYGIYENRFIMTLINRLITFLSNRYEVVKSNIESYERKHLNLKSKFNIFESEVAMDIDLVFKESVDNEEVKEKSKIYLSRVTNLTRMVAGYKNSPFMKMMDGQKPVKPPIMKTNIILKTPISGTHIIYGYFSTIAIRSFTISTSRSEILTSLPRICTILTKSPLSPMLWCFIIRTYRRKITTLPI